MNTKLAFLALTTLALRLPAAGQNTAPPPLTKEDCELLLVHPPEHVYAMKGITLEAAKVLAERAKKECPSASVPAAAPAAAQDPHAHHHAPADHAVHSAHATAGLLGGYSMDRDASGTSWQPEAAGMGGLMGSQKGWSTMAHGFMQAGGSFQGSPRGESAPFTASMVMGSAQKKVGPGSLTMRSMISADPILSPKGYPLLFQTGETNDGKTPLVNRQHAHDFFMENAVAYNAALSAGKSVFAYVGLPGEPALGPSVFMHRASGERMPDAPIGHHYMDATHVAYGVVTGGFTTGKWKFDASKFNGREPDEKRMGIELRGLDSHSARVTYNPTENWSLQASAGRLASPEGSDPDLSMNRVTASAQYFGDVAGRALAATAAFGRNMLSTGDTLDAYIAEATLRATGKTRVFGRYEFAQKQGLEGETHHAPEPASTPDHHHEPGHEHGHGTPAPAPAPEHAGHHSGRIFGVQKLSAGVERELFKQGPVRYSVGAMGSVARPPKELRPEYGSSPLSAFVWLSARLGR